MAGLTRAEIFLLARAPGRFIELIKLRGNMRHSRRSFVLLLFFFPSPPFVFPISVDSFRP